MHSKKIKVTVVQLATPNIDDYAIYSMLSVNHYCKLNGYDHFIQRSKTIEDMHINWSKIDLLQKAFDFVPENEYILLVDADVIINDYSKSITYFLDKFGKSNTEVMMPQDTPLKLIRSPRPNAGFVLLKNTAKGRKLVDDWLEASRGKCAHMSDTHPRNQRVYWNCVMPDYLDHQVVLPRWYFQKPIFIFGKNIMPSKFIYHITQSNNEDRIATMRAMCSAKMPLDDEKVGDMRRVIAEDATYVRVTL